MSVIIWILVSIFIFSIIVLVHEYWHYKTAKIFGIKVDEFGLWIPPRAKKLWKNASGTIFSLNWIPLGGFVKISGESERFLEYFNKKKRLLSHKTLLKKIKNHDDIFDKYWKKISKPERKYLQSVLKSESPGENFYEKNIFQKSLVLLAWVIMNFILAGVIFSFLFFIGVKPIGINTIIPTDLPSKIIPTLDDSIAMWLIEEKEWILLFPIENSPAIGAGIEEADKLLKIDGEKVMDISEVQSYVAQSAWKVITLYIERKTACHPADTKREKCPILDYMEKPVLVWADGRIWTYLSPNLEVKEDFTYSYPIVTATKHGFLEVYYQSRLTLTGIWILFRKAFFPQNSEERAEALDSVAWPIGIVWVITNSLESGIVFLIILSAIISVNLGVFNLLPIPALDGGRLILLWIRSATDALFGKSKRSADIENMVHVLFFLLLIALSVLIAYNDIVKIFQN